MNLLKRILLLFLFSSLSALLTAQSDLSSIGENKRITIKVGYDKGYGIIEDSESLDYRGFGYEILERSEHYSNFDFAFYEYDYWDALAALENGEIDMMGIMLESETYRNLFSYVPKPLGSTQLILATKENEILYDDPSAIDNKIVASFQNNPYEKYLDEYCIENGITVSYIRGESDNYVNLEADFYLITTIDQNVEDLRMVMNLEVFDMFFITHKENPTLANEIADAINLSISADGTFLQELQIKYYGSKNLGRRYLTQAEVDLLKSQTLVCGYIDHHQPIQYTNNDGLPDGISVQVMNMLAEKYGFKIEYVPYNHDMPNESHENFDMLISATGNFEHEMEFYFPSEPFMHLPMMLLAENNYIEQVISAEYESMLGMVNYVTLDHTDVLERYPNNSVLSYDRFDELLEAYEKREVNGLLATENGVEYAQAVFGENNYSIRSTGLSLPLRIFFSRSSEHLTEYIGAFNIMFEHLEQERVDEIMSMQSVRFLPEYSISVFIEENLGLLLVIFLAVLLVIFSNMFYQQYKRKKAILDIINYDALTGLISVYNFTERVKLILQTSKPNEYEIIVFDIDSFRTINTIYSKNKGDLVIRAIAKMLEKTYKNTGTLVSRIIADQFVIFHKVNEGESLLKIFDEYVTTAIKSVMGEKYTFSLSVGICIIKDTTLAVETLIDHAVAAHFKGKKKYVITYNVYNDEVEKELNLKTSIVHRMNESLQSNEFKVFYQPKIAFDSLKVGGAEALVRWFDKDNTMVSTPDVFIGIFESNGFIVKLDTYIFEEVCKFISQNGKDITIPPISVNVSTVTLFDDNFPSAYFDIVHKYNIPPNRLEIEITESAITLDQRVLVEKAKQIRAFGMLLSIDDFGAGESSLNRLGTIMIDTIKLDKAFLDYNIAEERGAIVVDTVIKMAKQLNMKVVTEGVETIEQVKWLKGLDCDYAQGFFFEKPMRQDDFRDLLCSNKTYGVDSDTLP